MAHDKLPENLTAKEAKIIYDVLYEERKTTAAKCGLDITNPQALKGIAAEAIGLLNTITKPVNRILAERQGK